MSTGKLIETVETLRAEVASLKASQCTSPWEDSPPCRGIQRQLDIVADLTQQLAAANGRVERMREALLLCEGFVRAYGQPETRAIVAAALSNLPEADKEKTK